MAATSPPNLSYSASTVYNYLLNSSTCKLYTARLRYTFSKVRCASQRHLLEFHTKKLETPKPILWLVPKKQKIRKPFLHLLCLFFLLIIYFSRQHSVKFY